jgi:hypothetical protein
MGLVMNTVAGILSTGTTTLPVALPPCVPATGASVRRLASELMPREVLRIRISDVVQSPVHAVLGQLSELEDGWFGERSAAPTDAVKREMAIALSSVGFHATPIAEVDEDGSVALVWSRDGKSFALTFTGNGQVIGTLFPQASGYPPWSLGIEAHREIAERLSTEEIAALLS